MATAIVAAAPRGWATDLVPMSDGGEGFLDVFDVELHTIATRGPLGGPVEARLGIYEQHGRRLAVAESADVVGHRTDPITSSRLALRASTAGLAKVLQHAARLGCELLTLGCGGTVTSDGGLGLYEQLRADGGLPLEVRCATDVSTAFSGAVGFATQKGVDPADLQEVAARLATLRARYLDECGIDVERAERTGAAGGLVGGLVALGASAVSGFAAAAEGTKLEERAAGATLVVTGEGRFDLTSLEGKVTIGVADLLGDRPSRRLVVACGGVDPEAVEPFSARHPTAQLISLEQRFGPAASRRDLSGCLGAVVAKACEEVS